jgi:ribonuclease HII
MALLSFYDANTTEAGCDEAGRGCLAGPVVAAAVILPQTYQHKVLNDSKKLTAKQREYLKDEIKSVALAWGIGVVSHQEIDEINILNASFLAMHRAVEKLTVRPELLLIDGNRFNPYPDIKHVTIVKGDAKYYSIAAASVLAKTYRDELMSDLHEKFPEYGWITNAGYPTKSHRNAIRIFGPTPHHRMSFKLLPEQLEIFK